MADSRLHQLSRSGSASGSTISRATCSTTGGLKRMMEEDAVVGVTSNPTIFQKAISQGDAYDEQLRELLGHETGREGDLPRARGARRRGGLRPAARRCGRAEGPGRLRLDRGRPDPRLRHRRHLRRGDAPARAGRPAEPLREDPRRRSRACRRSRTDRRRPQHQRHAHLLAAAPQRGDGGVHPRARAARRGRRRPAPVARSRASSSRASTPRPTSGSRRSAATTRSGKLAIANAKLAYQHYQQAFSGERWEALEAKGALQQRCLWASTSTKNPAYRDVLYVEELIGPDTVNTMPEETIQAFQDHGEVAATVRRDSTRPQLFEQLAAVGVDYDDVVRPGREAWRSSPTPSRSCSTASGEVRELLADPPPCGGRAGGAGLAGA